MIPRVTPLRDQRWKREKGGKITVARAGPLPPPEFGRMARGPPERPKDRTYERKPEEEPDDNVIDLFKHTGGDKDKSE